jgi:hypothetical protein
LQPALRNDPDTLAHNRQAVADRRLSWRCDDPEW